MLKFHLHSLILLPNSIIKDVLSSNICYFSQRHLYAFNNPENTQINCYWPCDRVSWINQLTFFKPLFNITHFSAFWHKKENPTSNLIMCIAFPKQEKANLKNLISNIFWLLLFSFCRCNNASDDAQLLGRKHRGNSGSPESFTSGLLRTSLWR